ncbi:MAG: HEAT repeat domain-containing protein [Chloroflexi bacterium]|nr:HEAT repeat domain-containing protein [Chloroflexota bacterium]
MRDEHQDPALGGKRRQPSPHEHDVRLGGAAALVHIIEKLDDESASVRARAIRELAHISDDEAIHQLIDLSRSGNHRQRRQAIAALGKTRHPAGLARLVEIVQTVGDVSLRRVAILALGRTRDPQYVEVIGQYFDFRANQTFTSEVVADALGRIGQHHPETIRPYVDRVVEYILHPARIPRRVRRVSVYMALHRLGSDDALNLLCQIAQEPTEAVDRRIHALDALQYQSHRQVKDVFLAILRESSTALMFERAVDGLLAMKDTRLESALADLLRNGHPSARIWAAQHIRSNQIRATIPTLIEACLDDTEVDVRQAALDALWTIDYLEAIPVCIKLLYDVNQQVQQMARLALERVMRYGDLSEHTRWAVGYVLEDRSIL